MQASPFEFNKIPQSIKVDDITYKSLKQHIKRNTINEIDLKECGIKASSLVYTVIKRSIRYSFIVQLKQAFGWYLDINKEKDPEIKSIISDTNLYYTRDIINIKQNIKYLKNIITFCDSILSIKRKRKSIMNKDDNLFLGLKKLFDSLENTFSSFLTLVCFCLNINCLKEAGISLFKSYFFPERGFVNVN